MAKLKKIISYIFYTFLILLVSLCIYTFIAIDILGKDYANVFGYTYFVVATGSMSGTIEVNDVVIIKVGDTYSTNDIITYKDNSGEFITHRYIKEINNKLITKGDANNTEDDPISKKQVIGKVISIIEPTFIFKLLAIIVIIVILIILFNFDTFCKKIIKNDKSEKITKKNNTELNQKKESLSNKETQKKKKYRTRHKKTKENILQENKDSIKPIIPNKQVIPVTGDTIKIPIGEIINFSSNKNNNKKTKINYELDKNHTKEEELLKQTVKLLKLKNDNMISSKINRSWILKYQYIYKLGCIITFEDNIELESIIKKTTFKELYDYDMDEAGLYENLVNKIYDMPIYVFLQILVFSILYNDLEFFDGIYKILKYKIQIDKEGEFTRIGKGDNLNKQKINELLSFMMKISKKFDTKNVLELDKIKEFVKLKKYINN